MSFGQGNQNPARGGASVYRALLSQSGTDAPVATVLENTLGGEVVWTRLGAGAYRGTLVGGFAGAVPDRGFHSASIGDNSGVAISKLTDDTVSLLSGYFGGAVADSVMVSQYVEILVYP